MELYKPLTLVLSPRSGVTGTGDTRPPVYKVIGISLAIASGVFIGTSFVLKKMGLLKANVKYNEEAGEGYGYLKNVWWWTGMTLMIIGEVCNFVAYAFVDAILVTPLGALSVVITTILSAIFLKERLSFVGKVGCFLCIIGSVVIVMNAPKQSSAANIQEMKKFVIAPGFLVYTGIILIGSAFIAWWVAPRYGKKNMLVHLTICSWIGGLSVVSTQGLGAAIVAQAAGKPQFNQWFLYVLLVFVVSTLITEIIYLNKALNLFNAALVTPTYYVYFTSATIITSAILFQGFKGTPTSIITVVMGFFVICSGVVLLQLSKSAKEVPDSAVFAGDLDQVRTVAEQEEPESEPKADAIRGTAAIIRRISNARQGMEAKEAKRVHEDRLKDQMEAIGEDEQVQWDGLRRRKTTISSNQSGSIRRQKTIHPPLGMTHFPSSPPTPHSHSSPRSSRDGDRPRSSDIHGSTSLFHGSLFDSIRRYKPARKDSVPAQARTVHAMQPPSQARTHLPQRPVTEVVVPENEFDGSDDTAYHGGLSADALELTARSTTADQRQKKPIIWAEDVQSPPQTAKSAHSGKGSGSSGGGGGGGKSAKTDFLAPESSPHQRTKRQFSFQNVFSRRRGSSVGHDGPNDEVVDVLPRPSLRSRGSEYEVKVVGGTEEERAGLVKGDSRVDETDEEGSVKGGGFAEADEPESDEDEDEQVDERGGSGGRFRDDGRAGKRGRFERYGDDGGGGGSGASGRPAFI